MVSLARFAIFGAAAGYAAQIGGRDPVLAFLRQEVVGDAKKTFDRDFDTDFFESFTEGTVVKSFEVFQFAADDAPAPCFRRKLAKGEKGAVAKVEDEDTNANSWKRGWQGEIVFHGHGWQKTDLAEMGRSMLRPYKFNRPRCAERAGAARG